MDVALTSIPLTSLPKLTSGKVRDLYTLPDPTQLLFVASDRISAFDVVMTNGIPGRGIILTQMTAHWLAVLTTALPGLKTHLISLTPPPALPLTPPERAALRGRAMVVRRLRIFPIEVIVRGYLAGSAWAEYAAHGTMHGLPLPPGLERCAPLPRAMYTPSTKAAAGAHDENITPAAAAALVGERYARRIEELAVALYTAARAYAGARGIIVADTKFEFGLDEAADEIVLVDEVLTPDSSRFWPVEGYAPGREQESLDKQFIRNWLVREGLKGKEGTTVPDEVAAATAGRYRDVFGMLTGRTVEEALGALEP